MMVFDPELHKARRGWKPLTLVLLVSAWLALVGNLALWRTIWALPELNGWRGMVFSLALAAWIGSALVVLLSLLAWPRLFKPLARRLQRRFVRASQRAMKREIKLLEH